MSRPLMLGVRLARRELVRRPWRSALVVLMILIPTAAMTVVTAYLRTGDWSSTEWARANFGRADAYAYMSPPGSADIDTNPVRYSSAVTGGDIALLRAALPAGSEVVVDNFTGDRAQRGERRSYMRISDLRLDEPRTEGRFTAMRGRLPTGPDEAVITEPLADDLDIGIGDVLRPQRLGRDLRVVGMVRLRAAPGKVAYTQGALTSPGASPASVSAQVLIDLPPEHAGRYETGSSESVSSTTSDSTWKVRPVPTGGRTSPGGFFLAYTAGVVGLVVVSTVIAAAFALGARRQLHTLGLLSASGASPSILRRFLVTQGVLSGLVGSLTGIALGLAVAWATSDRFLSDMADRPVVTPTVRLSDLLAILLLGVTAAAVSAWLPARTMAAIQTLQALAGRPPLTRVPLRLPIRGMVLIGLGCAFFALSIKSGPEVTVVAALCVMFGTLAIAPWAVAGLERLSARFSQTWRMASRSLARNRARSSAVVGAICAISATILAGFTLFNSYDARPRSRSSELPYLRGNQLLINSHEYVARQSVLDRVKQILPKARVVEIHWVTAQPGPDTKASPGKDVYGRLFGIEETEHRSTENVALATPEMLDLLSVPQQLRNALDRGEAIAVTVEGRPVTGGVVDGSVGIPFGGSFRSEAVSGNVPRILLGPVGLDRLGLGSRESGIDLVYSPSPPHSDQRRALENLSSDLYWESQLPGWRGSIYIQLPPEKEPWSRSMVKGGLFGLSFVVVLAIVGVALGLAAHDTRDERQVLSALGASPRTLRQVAARRAFLLVSTATAIALPAALLPSAAIIAALNADSIRSYPFRLDLWALLFVVVVLPAAAGLMALVGGRLRDLFRPIRPDTFTFAE